MQAVGYIRVSTRRQAQSGLGLEAQEAAVQTFCRNNGRDLIATFREIESGRRSDRPELLEALELAKHTKAVLVVAKLDRLARNLSFLAQLLDSGVEFLCCDVPVANKLTIHVLAAVAEDEAQRISERTKAALRAAKDRGVRLGSSRPGHWEGREHLRELGQRKGLNRSRQVRKAAAREFAEFLAPRVLEARASGCTHSQIAVMLNQQGLRTRRGKLWTPAGVWRLCKKLESADTPRLPSRPDQRT